VPRYLLRRLLHALIVLLGVTLLTFLLTRVVGDPVQLMLGRGTPASPEVVQRIKESLGLNDPMWLQYLHWLGDAVRGDLGRSYASPVSVTSAIVSAAPVTIELMVLALALAIVVGIAVGTMAALRPGSAFDNATTVASSVTIALPNFWLGLLLIFVFALHVGFVPSSGYTPFSEDPLENLRDMILPVLTLGAFYAGSYVRYMRSLVLAGLSQDYVRAARAKGVSRKVLLVHHVLRNAMVPFVTVIGLDIAGLLGGAVVTEVVFSLPGIGSLLESSILSGNVPVVEGTVLVVCASVVLLNVVLDIVYGYLNPQIRLGMA
jgi:peptide/nickel transport system permease protein